MIRRQIFQTVGILLIMLGLSMFLSAAWSLYYGDGDIIPILQSIAITVGSGFILFLVFRSKNKIDLSKIDTVILAGGLGTRLQPLVKNMPKCLVPINGKPFILKNNMTSKKYCATKS